MNIIRLQSILFASVLVVASASYSSGKPMETFVITGSSDTDNSISKEEAERMILDSLTSTKGTVNLSDGGATKQSLEQRSVEDKKKISESKSKSKKKSYFFSNLWRSIIPAGGHIKTYWEHEYEKEDGKTKGKFRVEIHIEIDREATKLNYNVVDVASSTIVAGGDVGGGLLCGDNSFDPESESQCAFISIYPIKELGGYVLSLRLVDKIVRRQGNRISYDSSDSQLNRIYTGTIDEMFEVLREL